MIVNGHYSEKYRRLFWLVVSEMTFIILGILVKIIYVLNMWKNGSNTEKEYVNDLGTVFPNNSGLTFFPALWFSEILVVTSSSVVQSTLRLKRSFECNQYEFYVRMLLCVKL